MSLFDQINTAANSNEAAANEKHLPIVKVESLGNNKYRVKIDVGGGKHPNEIDHWIQWVELRVNDLFIGRAEFSAKIMEPVVDFTVVYDKKPFTISAIERCNKHGLWETKVKID